MDESHTEIVEKRPGNQTAGGKYRRRLTRREEAKVLSYSQRGVEQKDIATAMGVSVDCIERTVKSFAPVIKNLEEIRDFRNSRADLFDAAQMTFLRSAINAAERLDTPLNHASSALKNAYLMSRLERGLSTDNKSVRSESHVSVSLSRLSDDDE